MGFDFVAPVEHHFTDYAMCPDRFRFLSLVAAKTKTMEPMTRAVILPWNDPLRVVETTILLDLMSEDRMIGGMPYDERRGAAKHQTHGAEEDRSHAGSETG